MTRATVKRSGRFRPLRSCKLPRRSKRPKPLPKAGDTVHFDFNNIDETGTVGNRGDRFALIMDTAGSGGNCIVGWNGYPFENTRNVHVYGEVPRGKSSPDGRVVDGAKFVEAS